MNVLSKTNNSERKNDSTKIAHDLTTSLTRDIQIQHDIIVKLIDKINKLKDSVDAVYHTKDTGERKRRWK